MQFTLRLAPIYNSLWGAWVVLFPNHFFNRVGMEPLNHPLVWQGRAIGLYGISHWWVYYNPLKHGPILAVACLEKSFGPLGFIFNYIKDEVPFKFSDIRFINDSIWWIHSLLILNKAHTDYKWKLS